MAYTQDTPRPLRLVGTPSASAVDALTNAVTSEVATLARTVEAMVSGSLMTWAFYSEGPAERWIRDDVNAVLAPYLAPRKRAKAR